jgi:ribosomal protein S18 acetylase RimI-like enzyme
MKEGEEQEVCDLVIRVFNEFVAHQYSEQRIQEFMKYVEPQCLSKRCQEHDFVVLAKTKDKIVGMIELRGNCHISLFYVEGHLQRIHIGTELLKKCLEICRRVNPALTEITVDSSPNALKIFKKLGFSVMEPEKEKNGTHFVPMKLELSNSYDTLSAQLYSSRQHVVG